MKPAAFEHHPVGTVEEAIDLLGELGDDAKVLAGGQSLVPVLALRLARFDHLIDINPMAGDPVLGGVSQADGVTTVGAAARHRAVERSEQLAQSVPLLARATAHVGHFQIRNRGTLGGAIAHADPAAEQPAVALALDAVMVARSRRGERRIPAADFFVGTWTTSMDPDEMLTAVEFPARRPRSGFAVEEVARRRGDFAMVGVACGLSLDPSGGVEWCGLAAFGIGSTPVRLSGAESAVRSGADADSIVAAAVEGLEPTADIHASAQYRKKVTGVLVARAVARAMEEARGV
ncbi:MAG TPA: xanthine dehydrogenase family protein subunit M [Acidimicrobiales bacterium]|nr:xanthine dehydrogenase family protein subunit M [Acidimicrobiales bacterium]